MGTITFGHNAGIPLYDRPIAACRCECGSAKSADECVTRARRQTKPPRGDVPRERSKRRGENRRHCNHVGVNKALADCRCHSAAEERASQIKKAAIAMAWRGVRTLVETTVAIALAAS